MTVKMIRDIVINVSLVSMDIIVNTIVVYVKMNVVIYVFARVVVEMDIMSLQLVSKQYVNLVRQIASNVRMPEHVIFAIMVFTSISIMTMFTVCHVSKTRNVRIVLFKVVTSVKYAMIR
jgi:hypothetical protein